MRRDLGLLEQLWRERPWTDADIASRIGVTVNNLTMIRFRYFRHVPMVHTRNEQGRTTRQIVDAQTPRCVEAAEASVCNGLFSLVAAQAEEIVRLRGLVHDLETRIVDERIARASQPTIAIERIDSWHGIVDGRPFTLPLRAQGSV